MKKINDYLIDLFFSKHFTSVIMLIALITFLMLISTLIWGFNEKIHKPCEEYLEVKLKDVPARCFKTADQINKGL